MATGDAIGIVGSDDFYPNNEAISNIVKGFEESNADSVYGDLYYVDSINTNKIIRKWKSGNYSKKRFLNGWMPPHTAFFIKKSAYDTYGLYHSSYRFAGDYELMLRMLYRYDVSSYYVPKVIMKMRAGGNSNSSIKGRIKANKEDRKAWIDNGIQPRWYTLYAKPLSKILQWILK
jgi:hypothetical protein